MAKIYDMNEEQRKEWNAWLETRPEMVKSLAQRFPPNELFRMKSTGQRVTIYSISEDETLTVCVTGDFNKVAFARRVFGVRPEDLEPCELPAEGEELGAALTDQEDIYNYLQVLKNPSAAH